MPTGRQLEWPNFRGTENWNRLHGDICITVCLLSLVNFSFMLIIFQPLVLKERQIRKAKGTAQNFGWSAKHFFFCLFELSANSVVCQSAWHRTFDNRTTFVQFLPRSIARVELFRANLEFYFYTLEHNSPVSVPRILHCTGLHWGRMEIATLTLIFLP